MALRRKTGGRRAGTPNRRTALVRAGVASDADPVAFLTRVLNGETIDGKKPSIADRLVAARDLRRVLVPDAKERPLRVSLPPIAGAGDVPRAFTALFAAAAAGELTAGEARALADVLGATIKAFEVCEIERRITALEKRASGDV